MRLTGLCSEMGGANDIVQPQQRVIGWRRFLFKHIESRPSHGPIEQGFSQCRFFNNAATGTVHNTNATPHDFELIASDQMLRISGLRRMHRDKIRSREQGW